MEYMAGDGGSAEQLRDSFFNGDMDKVLDLAPQDCSVSDVDPVLVAMAIAEDILQRGEHSWLCEAITCLMFARAHHLPRESEDKDYVDILVDLKTKATFHELFTARVIDDNDSKIKYDILHKYFEPDLGTHVDMHSQSEHILDQDEGTYSEHLHRQAYSGIFNLISSEQRFENFRTNNTQHMLDSFHSNLVRKLKAYFTTIRRQIAAETTSKSSSQLPSVASLPKNNPTKGHSVVLLNMKQCSVVLERVLLPTCIKRKPMKDTLQTFGTFKSGESESDTSSDDSCWQAYNKPSHLKSKTCLKPTGFQQSDPHTGLVTSDSESDVLSSEKFHEWYPKQSWCSRQGAKSSESMAKSNQLETVLKTSTSNASLRSIKKTRLKRNMEDLSSSDSERHTIIRRPKFVTRRPMVRKGTTNTISKNFHKDQKSEFSEKTPKSLTGKTANAPSSLRRPLRNARVTRERGKVANTIQKRTLRSSVAKRNTSNAEQSTVPYSLRTCDKHSNLHSEYPLVHSVSSTPSEENESNDSLKDKVFVEVTSTTEYDCETPPVDEVHRESHSVPIRVGSSCSQDRVYKYTSTELTDHQDGVFWREATPPSHPSTPASSSPWIKGQMQHHFTTASRTFEECDAFQAPGAVDQMLEDKMVAYKITEELRGKGSVFKLLSGTGIDPCSMTLEQPVQQSQSTPVINHESSPCIYEVLKCLEDKGGPRLSTTPVTGTTIRRLKRKREFEETWTSTHKLRKTDALHDKSLPPTSERSPFRKVMRNLVLQDNPYRVPKALKRSANHKHVTFASNKKHVKQSTFDSSLKNRTEVRNPMQALVAGEQPESVSKATTGEEADTCSGDNDYSANTTSLRAVSNKLQQPIEPWPLSETGKNCSLEVGVNNSSPLQKHVSFCESTAFMQSPELAFFSKLSSSSAAVPQLLPLAQDTASSRRHKASKEPTARRRSVDVTTSVDSLTASISQTNPTPMLAGLVCTSPSDAYSSTSDNAPTHTGCPPKESDIESSNSLSAVYSLNDDCVESLILSQSQGPMQKFVSYNLPAESSSSEFVSESDMESPGQHVT